MSMKSGVRRSVIFLTIAAAGTSSAEAYSASECLAEAAIKLGLELMRELKPGSQEAKSVDAALVNPNQIAIEAQCRTEDLWPKFERPADHAGYLTALTIGQRAAYEKAQDLKAQIDRLQAIATSPDPATEARRDIEEINRKIKEIQALP